LTILFHLLSINVSIADSLDHFLNSITIVLLIKWDYHFS